LDQSVIARVVRVAPGRFAPGHLGELTQQVPFEMVDAVLAQTCRVQSRVRDLPARVVVYLLLAGCLFAELGYVQVWHRLTAGLDGLPTARPTAAALTQARRRLGAAPLRTLFDLLRGPAAVPGGTAGVRWRGLLVCAIDGTIMTVADSTANLAVYRKQRGGATGGSSYPMLRLLALVSCGTRSVIDAVSGPASSGETTYATQLTGSLRPGMIVLADRNFGAGALAA
jgi:Insertion element 4 transposase N-terminal/Transposase DDE domain